MTKTALISVSDKTGVTELAARLIALDYQVISTGGTARILREAGIPVTDVADVTGFPEHLNGRIKSLHPAIHAGIMAHRHQEEDMNFLKASKFPTIDLVIVSLYPFGQTIAREDVTFERATQMIDVGGPTLIRAAAWNYQDVTVICDLKDYGPLLQELEQEGTTSLESRYHYATKAYEHTAAYDALVARYFREQADTHGRVEPFPEKLTITYELDHTLDDVYAASPSALYRVPGPEDVNVSGIELIHGTQPNADHLLSADLAIQNLEPYIRPAVCAVKDNHLIGVAYGKTLDEAWDLLYKNHVYDLEGCLIAANEAIDDEVATDLVAVSVRTVLAQAYLGDSMDILSEREDLTLLVLPNLHLKRSESMHLASVSPVRHGDPVNPNHHGIKAEASFRTQPLRAGLLVATAENVLFQLQSFEIATERQLSRGDFGLIEAAMSALRTMPSASAIVWKGEGSIALSYGHMSIEEAVYEMLDTAENDLTDGILVLSVSFHDLDLLEAIQAEGIRMVVEPGCGQVIDEDKIEIANELDLALCFTGSRLDEASGGMIR